MRRLTMRFGSLFLLLLCAASVVAQESIDVVAIVVGDQVLNKRSCVSPTETQTDRCPRNFEEASCPSGNCNFNYENVCRMLQYPHPLFEQDYAIYDLNDDQEIENPKPVELGKDGVKAEEEEEKICYKRKRCVCEVLASSATCQTDDTEEKVVIKKWKKTATPCIGIRSLDPDEEELPFVP